MQSVTTLNLNLKYPNYATTMHAVQNDKLTRKVVAMLFDGSTPFVPDAEALGIVRFHKPDDTFGFYDVDEAGNTAVTWEGNVATISLAEQALACPGIVLCQIQFYTESGQRLTTFTWKIDVQECAMTDDQILSTDYYSVLTAQISAAMSITYRPPYINTTTGHWMTWSIVTNQYEDSGYSAQGTQGVPGLGISSVTKKSGTGAAGTTDVYNVNLENGEVAGTFDVYQGANGQAGASMTGITKVGGTGAGGTVDTYRVDLSNGQSGGTFDVYNGNDGTGAAGSATPLMDGTAAVGTAIAYSREDHVHPSDTSKVDVVAGKGLSTNDFTDALKDKLDGIAAGADVSPDASSTTPVMDGTGAVGISTDYARADHVHPADTNKQDKNIYFNASAPECTISTWTQQANPDITGFPYRADIYIAGITETMYAIVTFKTSDVLTGNYAPESFTHENGIYIYSKVNTAIVLDSIAIFK